MSYIVVGCGTQFLDHVEDSMLSFGDTMVAKSGNLAAWEYSYFITFIDSLQQKQNVPWIVAVQYLIS